MVFPTTHWSVLARAKLDGKTEAHTALNDLCQRYWLPLNQFIQMRGRTPTEAEDLTQAFLLHLLENSGFQKPDRLKGRFRSFLLGALAHFLSDERDYREAQKRGGKILHVSLDGENGAENCPAITAQEEVCFDRAWAVANLRACLARVQDEYASAGEEKLFLAARSFLPGASEPPSYEKAAASVDLSIGAFTSELHRLRKRVRELVREETLGTVSAPHEVEDEMAYLQQVLMDRGTDLRDENES